MVGTRVVKWAGNWAGAKVGSKAGWWDVCWVESSAEWRESLKVVQWAVSWVVSMAGSWVHAWADLSAASKAGLRVVMRGGDLAGQMAVLTADCLVVS